MTQPQVEKIKGRMRLLLREGRKAMRYSQTEFAKKLGLDQSALSRVESGKQGIDIEAWIRFIDWAAVDANAPLFESTTEEAIRRLRGDYA